MISWNQYTYDNDALVMMLLLIMMMMVVMMMMITKMMMMMLMVVMMTKMMMTTTMMITMMMMMMIIMMMMMMMRSRMWWKRIRRRSDHLRWYGWRHEEQSHVCQYHELMKKNATKMHQPTVLSNKSHASRTTHFIDIVNVVGSTLFQIG